MQAKNIVLIVVAVLILILLFQNAESISLRAYFWHLEVPKLLAGMVLLLVGYLLGYFTPRIAARRKQQLQKKQQQG